VSFEEYLAGEESAEVKHELLDGGVYATTGATLRHATVTGNIFVALRQALRGTRCRVYASDALVRTPDDAGFYPDVVVTCSDRDTHPRTIAHPNLVVEVLSDGTAAYDRGLKFDRYRAIPALQEYMLVDPDRVAIDLYRRSEAGLWVLHPSRLGDPVELASVGVTIPVETIYEDASP
jgi:Uma2 family endonuclease